MRQILGQIFFDARQMCEILGFVVALVEAGKNTEDFRRPLGAKHRIGAGKPGHVEARVGDAPQLGIVAE